MDQTTKQLYMKSNFSAHPSKSFHVMLIGNNPREMGCLSNFLNRFTWKKFTVTTAFDVEQGFQKFDKSTPDYVMLDEALGHEALQSFARYVRRNKRFNPTALAILKNTNESEFMIPGVQDYLLKSNIFSDTLPLTILNAIKLSRRKDSLLKAVEKKKSSALNLSWFNTAFSWKEG
ncbi:MAG: hypothetical protein ACR2MX_06045 [Cyclobacteriaceae bacterium]